MGKGSGGREGDWGSYERAHGAHDGEYDEWLSMVMNTEHYICNHEDAPRPRFPTRPTFQTKFPDQGKLLTTSALLPVTMPILLLALDPTVLRCTASATFYFHIQSRYP